MSVSNCERLNDSWVCGLAENLLYWLFPMLWQNCNFFSDWDYSLLVFNEVSDSYLKLWMNCYFSIRNHDALMSVFYFYRHLSLIMWTYFSISDFAWGQARSNLGGVNTSILHHVLLLFMMFLSIIMLFGVILMPFLS